MNGQFEFIKLIIDSIAESIAVIDSEGRIIFVNKSWVVFGQNNNCSISTDWNGVNYLDECDKAAMMGDHFGSEAANGIRQLMHSDQNLFNFEYPCHGNIEKRWFMMRVTKFTMHGDQYFVISHLDITKRKLAEDEALKLSRIDGLVNIQNRRCFDEFLHNEWKRCARLAMPLTLAIIDIDYFKIFNDTYGHQEGDSCLKIIGETLQKFARRPSDICARYGGEEFAIVYGNTNLNDALSEFKNIINDINLLKIPNENSLIKPTVTVSIGVVTLYPSRNDSEQEILKQADQQLYCAKRNGRNQISFKKFG